MWYGAYNTCKSEMYENNRMKVTGKKQKYTVGDILHTKRAISSEARL